MSHGQSVRKDCVFILHHTGDRISCRLPNDVLWVWIRTLVQRGPLWPWDTIRQVLSSAKVEIHYSLHCQNLNSVQCSILGYIVESLNCLSCAGGAGAHLCQHGQRGPGAVRGGTLKTCNPAYSHTFAPTGNFLPPINPTRLLFLDCGNKDKNPYAVILFQCSF